MNFVPKHHLEINNYIKYIDEILHKCDKGIEYCKICPNEFVCTELEKDDFGLAGSTITDVLTAIQCALNKIPGYLNPQKRNELREHITKYINESPIHERKIWEDSILDILLDEKLANPAYKPKAKIGAVRILLTYNSRISFSTYLKCLRLEDKGPILNTKETLHHEITLNSTKIVNQFILNKHINIAVPGKMDSIIYCLEKDADEIMRGCNFNDIGLAAALSYYSMLSRSLIPENIVVTGGLDGQGRTLQVNYLDSKIETVLRELHFIDTIIISRGSSFGIPVPGNINIIDVDDLEQTIHRVFKNDLIN